LRRGLAGQLYSAHERALARSRSVRPTDTFDREEGQLHRAIVLSARDVREMTTTDNEEVCRTHDGSGMVPCSTVGRWSRSSGDLLLASRLRPFGRPGCLPKCWGRIDERYPRSTTASLAAAPGATVAELMHRSGHASPAAALRYQHVTSDRDHALAAAPGQLAAPATTHPIHVSTKPRGASSA